MGTRTRLAVAVLSIGALLLAGCSTGAVEPAAKPAPSKVATVKPSATPTPSPTPVPLRSLVFSSCDPSTQLLTFTYINVATGSVSQPLSTFAACNSGTQAISPDLKRVAVQLPAGTDGSSRVGWTNLTTGLTTDVTEEISEAQDAMAAVPQHQYPIFSPDGAFVYVDAGQKAVNAVDVSFFTVTTLMTVDYAYAVHIGPNGDLSGIGGFTEHAYATEIPGAPGSLYCDSYKNSAQSWPGDGTVLRRDDNRVSVVKDTGVTIGSGCNGTEVVRYLSPESDFQIGAAILDPTSGIVYFLATRGTEETLFQVPFDGSAAPVALADLSVFARVWPQDLLSVVDR